MKQGLIKSALEKEAAIYASVSGGKDSQAMVKTLFENNIPVSALVFADLGSIDWPQSILQCEKTAREFNTPLVGVKRKDGFSLIEYWQRKMHKLAGKNIPFWSKIKYRYCTSDLKTGPINAFFSKTGKPFVISAEGIRKSESIERSKRQPLTIRLKKSSTYYHNMTVEEAISKFRPDKKLALTWYPIFNYSIEQVWATYGMNNEYLDAARQIYQRQQRIPTWWPFHPAYVFGSSRVSCRYCVLSNINDLRIAASHDKDQTLKKLIALENKSGFTFKKGFSLKQLLPFYKNTR